MEAEQHHYRVRIRPYLRATWWERIQAIARTSETTDGETLQAVIRLGLETALRANWDDRPQGRRAGLRDVVRRVGALPLDLPVVLTADGRLQA